MSKRWMNKKAVIFGTVLLLGLLIVAWNSGICRSDKAILNITSDPEGAKVTVDSGETGKTPCTLEVTPGNRQVKIKRRAYIAAQVDVEVKAAETKEINVKLTPIPTT